ncbi:hypothetical protein MBBA_0686 [Methanoculleus bourgensis]|nr:hypothetical protein MBBA_0686 [Methanoculleus bourgensis]
MGQSYRLGFNPCFRGCSSETMHGASADAVMERFNPCFRGCSSETPGPGPSGRFSDLVSILVFVDVPLRPGLHVLHDERRPVSILVFVDVPLRQVVAWCDDDRPDSVSILVFVDVPLRLEAGPPPGLPLPVSILVFVDVPLRRLRISSGWIGFGFNPCFRGCSSETAWRDGWVTICPQFQSLFSWMFL